MAEIFVAFPTRIASRDGHFYTARACGGKTVDGLWRGWIEFTPVDGGAPIRSPRETTQPNRVDTEYWATGLTPVYLEGALQRALSGPPTIRAATAERPAFEAPLTGARYAVVGSREAALDPFSAYEMGEQLLRKQLGALSDWHLVNIALAYDLTDESVETLNHRSPAYLTELILSGVRSRLKIAER